METITLQPVFDDLTRQRYEVCDRIMATMKTSVKTSHLRHVGQTFENRLDRGEIVRLVQRS